MEQMVQGMVETQVWIEVGMQNLNAVKVGLEMASISFVFLAFLHVVFNAI
jgi:hypothetical protein